MMLFEFVEAGVVQLDAEDLAVYGNWLAQIDTNDRGLRYCRIWQTDLVNGYLQKQSLARVLLKADDNIIVDHENGNSLDNRRHNLRLATLAQNSMNRSIASHNTSGYKGVSWHKRSKNFQVRITVNKEIQTLGSVLDPVVGARMYDEAAKKYFGEFAKLNFPETV